MSLRRFRPAVPTCLHMMSYFGAILCFALLICSGATSLQAQSTSAAINGLITDSQGKVVPNTEVAATNVDTNVAYPSKSNQSGIYVIAAIPPGRYRLMIRKDGFKEINKTDIVLNIQDALEQNFTLEVGSASESVTVSGATPNINTTDASVSTVVDRQFVENVPLNGRSFQTLLELSPGVTLTASNINDTGQFSVNGQRADANYFTVDGVSANTGATVAYTLNQSGSGSDAGYSASGGTNSLVSVDAMQEFRIQTSTFAPEFGRTPGGQVSIVTRSGTNQFHGTAFDYFRNNALDAASWFVDHSQLPKPAERQNDFGGVIGGPIFKNHTFFFFSYEGLRLQQPQSGIESVPDATTRAAAPNAIIGDFLKAFPLPNGPELGGGLAQENASFSNPSNLNSYSLRIDHTINSKLALFIRYGYAPSEVDSLGAAFGGNGDDLADIEGTFITPHTITLGLTAAISPVITNEFRANYSNSKASQIYTMSNYGGAVPLTIDQLKTAGFPSNSTLQNSDFTFAAFVTGQILNLGANDVNEQRQLNFVDNLSWILGTHQLKFGVDYRWLAPFSSATPYAQGVYFLNFSNTPGNVLSGTPIEVPIASTTGAPFLTKNFSLYAQDTWKATTHFVLTYGLRWDVNPPPAGKHMQTAPLTVIGLSNPSTMTLAPQGTPFYATTWGNVAPRVGVVYKLNEATGRETVVRGGFGIFYDTAGGNLGQASGGFPYDALKILSGVPYPLTPAQAAAPAYSTVPPVSGALFVTDPNLKLPRTYEMNLAVEQSLGASQTVSATYVGAIGTNVLRSYYLVTPNSQFTGFVNVAGNSGASNYHSLQLKYHRTLFRGLQALASYTYSHSIDNGSDDVGTNYLTPAQAANTSVDRSSSDFDIRNSFSTAFTYDIAAKSENRFVNAVIRDWSVDAFMVARSSTPVNVVNASVLAGYQFNLRPNLVAGQPLVLYGSKYAGGKAFNPAAFSATGLIQDGNFSRNYLRGFSAWQTDMAIHREFHLPEKIALQFRAEAFNIFNHPNFASPTGSLGSPQFGQSTTTLASGLGGLSALYQIGGPRSLQLALKLTF
jgi:hypothetical protein